MSLDQTITEPEESSVELIEPLRFDIKSLMILTAVCAASVALVDHFSILATVLLFILYFLTSLYLWKNEGIATRRFWLQAMWGIIMPLACLYTDPFVFTSTLSLQERLGSGSDLLQSISSNSAAIYVFIIWQMIMLVASWFVTPSHPMMASFLAGSLLTGMLFSAFLGIILCIPAAVFTLFLLMGLPGFTPLLTAKVFLAAHRYCKQVADVNAEAGSNYGLRALGLLTAVGIGFASYAVWPLFTAN